LSKLIWRNARASWTIPQNREPNFLKLKKLTLESLRGYEILQNENTLSCPRFEVLYEEEGLHLESSECNEIHDILGIDHLTTTFVLGPTGEVKVRNLKKLIINPIWQSIGT
jgi:hypothetical protein